MSDEHLRAVADNVADFHEAKQQRALIRDSKGAVLGIEANALTLIREQERFAGVFFDEFHQAVCVQAGAGAQAWGDDDDIAGLEYLQRNHSSKMRIEVFARALRKVARERSRDALKDYLNGLPAWDGVARIDHWGVDALGCDDSEYTQAAGANMLKALVARGLEPGADVHECYILEGQQGIGKTRALRALAGRFYVEITAPIGSNDFMRELRGAWLADLAELSQIKRGSVEVVKQILSRNEDRFVEKFEREARAYLRRCVFAGSTNEGTYLADTTGNRRFIPLRCGQVRPDLIEANRDQYFAEALHRVAAGERWFDLPAPAAAQVEHERDARRIRDPWEEIFEAYLAGRSETWAGDLFANCLHTLARERTATDEQRIGRVLRSLGWNRQGNRQRREGVLVYVWRPPSPPGGGTGGTGGTA